MKGTLIGSLSLLSALLLLLVLSVAEAEEQIQADEGVNLIKAVINVPEDAKTDGNSAKLLFGPYSTTTYTVVSATTSTVFFTCMSGTANADVCTGRQGRRKRKAYSVTRDIPMVDDGGLEGSVNDDADLEPRTSVESTPEGPDGKFAFTVWTTSKITTSVTVLYTNTATTVRISFLCKAGQMAIPDAKCG